MLAEAYDLANKRDQAARSRMTLRARGDATGEDLFALGVYVRQNRRVNEAIEIFAEALQKQSGEPAFQLAVGKALASVLDDAGRNAEAIACRALLLAELDSKLERHETH